MCFSEAVSFATGGALIAGGGFATFKAARINRRYLPFAMMPAMAGVQQLFEGHVWMGLNVGDPTMVWWAALGFMFFSWFMWPAWVPFSVYVLEAPESRRKKMFLLFALAGVALGGILFVPHLLNADWIDVGINNRSLAYEDTMFLDYLMPRWMTYLIYLFLIIAPTLLSTYLHVRWFGLTLIVMLTVVYLFLSYAYISFFCLLAGFGTLHLIYIILRNKCRRECPVLFS
ncbi:MAG TPA: hypothetical protein DD728_09750 [Hyphomonas atlantica]|uniref:Uncharacterized protein n=1 Tax=Hyphomonas atlantica TaxID=1280948 RepID=A0A356W884_9PROT|nr:hypothetical protein [Rhodospirillaceae bacterium]HBQ49152.1 hypothetical protein [Hyphomonas atlantica]